MATRMQQRRGTAAQWTAANPILAAGEIGFETDTSKFKMGNGSSNWASLQYFANAAELANIIDGAPGLLDTLNELAAAINDDPEFFSTVGDQIDLKAPLASPALTGIPTAPTADSTTNTTQVATTAFVQAKINSLVNGAPELLNTLDEIAAAINDDEDFSTGIINSLGTKVSKHGDTMTGALTLDADPTNALHAATKSYVDAEITSARTYASGYADQAEIDAAATADTKIAEHNTLTTNVHGIADTSNLATLDDLANSVGTVTGGYSSLGGVGINWNSDTEQFDIDNTVATVTNLSDHNAETENVHGIADTADLATHTDVADAVAAQALLTTTEIGTHNSETTNVHGIADTADLALLVDVTDAVSDHNALTLNVHGIADTSALATTSATASAISTAVSNHNDDTTNVHGIADTAELATRSYADTAEADAITAAGTAADSKIATAVAALTKSSVGLGNVDNTSDENKPVSTATQTALDLKAPLAGPSFTGDANFEGSVTIEGNLVVEGTTTTVNTSEVQIDDPLFYLAANQYDTNTRDIGITGAYGEVGGTEQNHLHTGLVKDVTDGKWKLFSNAPHPVNNVVDFTSAAYDTLKVGPLEATTVTPSSGIVFSDGTQTKAGVPSITTFATEITSSATLAAGEQDKFVPLNGAVQITLPATGYSTGQSIDFYQATGTGASFASTNGVVGTPGRNFRTTNSVVTAMKTPTGWLIFGDLAV